MCGIVGILSNKLNSYNIATIVDKMSASIRHRGPDNSGVAIFDKCGMGHVRLSILDLTDAGSQPMCRDGVSLIFNGEIYNFIEEREKLLRNGFIFNGHSDAEVLLNLYLAYGEDCVKYIHGMFSFAIWDERSNVLFCARDPTGIKPFLYAETESGFVFASELKALLASGVVDKSINFQSLGLLLERGSIPQPSSILKYVEWLLPGHSLSVSPNGEKKIKCFFSLSEIKRETIPGAWTEVVKQGESILANVLNRQVVADVPVGAFLSGGIDSSLLVALMSRQFSNLKTFTIGFEGDLTRDASDESHDAMQIARYLGVSCKRVVIEDKDIANDLRLIAKGLDHPTVDGVNSWFVSKAASRELKVALSGTGGDELFGGYPWFSSMLKYQQRSPAIKLMDSFKGESFLKYFENQHKIFNKSDASRLLGYRKIDSLYMSDPLQGLDPISRVTGLLLNGYTRDQLLADIDTTSMSHGLEVRVPFLDDELIKFAISLPPSSKLGIEELNANPGSYAFSGAKKILLDIAKPYLPKDFANRTKKGFILPMNRWLRTAIFDEMCAALSYETVSKRGFFDPIAVNQVMNDFIAGKIHWTRPWLLMLTELWAQEVLDA